ncbi:activating signal cointegrator 1 complex subunit 1 [Aricia agestis]|uniref:activating signal cointegrator 1 complex subunit 1 n=1 Tax=Aricia agestis TaxID=91739 RepID=UPI001C20A22D|nr:activating signal cointegrator 1 complex subunit 1 [Aricia agestis]
MNVLKPELIWIEGRCYRVNDAHTDVSSFQEHDLYENEIAYQDEIDDEDDEDVEVLQMNNNRYYVNLHVPKHYLGAIIGKKGAVRMRLQHETKTDIKIPRMGDNKDVTIYGPSASNVKAARRKINMIVMSSRLRQRPTHFISIPLNKTNIISNFETFKKDVLQDFKDMEDTLFIRSSKLHVTIGVMCLMDNEERTSASKLFTETKDKIIMPYIRDYLPLRVRVQGITNMNDDPSATHVLYARVCEQDAPPGTLQTLVDAVSQYFQKAGLMRREHDRDNVKIHATLMNSKYRAEAQDSGEDDSSRPKRQPFDASKILAKYADYDFGVAEVTGMHLSQHHSMGEDGYYVATCVMNFD